MVCTYCGADTKVTNSRHQKRNNQIWRRRRCLSCGADFTTHETADLSSLLVVVVAGAHKPFSEDILFAELLMALSHRKDAYSAAREVTSTVIRQLLKDPAKPVYSPSAISAAAAGVLSRLDRQAWIRYVAEHPSLHP